MNNYLTSGYSQLNNSKYIVMKDTISQHPHLEDSCVLSDGKHRVLIKRRQHDIYIYSLNSCILKNNDLCIFEIND